MINACPLRKYQITPPGQVRYHIRLCVQAGYITMDEDHPLYMRALTWAGHNELDRLRNKDR